MLPENPSSPPATEDEHNFQPRNVLIFLALMLVGYAIYWFLIWYEIVIVRGIGG